MLTCILCFGCPKHCRSVMPLQAFSFPFPETRFFKAGSFIFKFKIRGGSSFSGEEVMEEICFYQELEDILRTVLGNLDSLQPFSSAHFNVFPYKKLWKGASKLMCKHGEGRLRAYPFSLILYLEKNTQNEGAKQAAEKLSPQKAVAQQLPSVSEPQSKRRRRDSPLEEAILKDLHGDMEAESTVSVVRRSLHCPHAQREVQEDRGHVDTPRNILSFPLSRIYKLTSSEHLCLCCSPRLALAQTGRITSVIKVNNSITSDTVCVCVCVSERESVCVFLLMCFRLISSKVSKLRSAPFSSKAFHLI
ncbi:membrane-anchored junction protein isoform X3 [Cyclopterus lumpus]|uniref:membrane-anchored junction protein isoform X3 n=1 Tax=Cyclopterus lumpus TaxID=8103 RepID=UPI001486BABE|nr:membrane-anchored junction protein isoform X3 [Cyclopterus lumpus]